LSDLAGSRCEFCKGQCLTLASNPVVGNHNPLLARLYALPQLASHGLSQHNASAHAQHEASHRHLRRRRHAEVSAVQTGSHAKKPHHAEVSTLKVGHYNPDLVY
jgi:hypothetical protein